MDNSKRSVHNSGPLGMLIKTGQIKKANLDEDYQGSVQKSDVNDMKAAGSYFKTTSGLEFKEDELSFVSPKECESWEYANRSNEEMGEIEDLINSINENGQLQPALVRTHPAPHDGIKYQIIFGKRRHAACLKLNKPFLVIKKDNLSVQDAISCQDAENKLRNDVSSYSNALLYAKLLKEKAFNSENELANKLGINKSSFCEIMAFSKIPNEIVKYIPEIHQIRPYFAAKLVTLLNQNKNYYSKMIELAPQFGRSINTPSKLEKALLADSSKAGVLRETIEIQGNSGEILFTFKTSSKGIPQIVFNRSLIGKIDFEKICNELKGLLS